MDIQLFRKAGVVGVLISALFLTISFLQVPDGSNIDRFSDLGLLPQTQAMFITSIVTSSVTGLVFLRLFVDNTFKTGRLFMITSTIGLLAFLGAAFVPGNQSQVYLNGIHEALILIFGHTFGLSMIIFTLRNSKRLPRDISSPVFLYVMAAVYVLAITPLLLAKWMVFGQLSFFSLMVFWIMRLALLRK